MCNALHVLLKGKIRTWMFGRIRQHRARGDDTGSHGSLALILFPKRKTNSPATFTVDEDVVLLKGSKESVFTLMHSMPLFLCIISFVSVQAAINVR